MERQNNNQAPVVFSHTALAANRRRAQAKLASHDFLFAEVQSRLEERLEEITKKFNSPLHMGFPHNVAKHHPQAENENLLLKPNQLDLITSNLQLHWANDLAGVLIQIKRALRPDGLFVASMFGGDTLFELKSSLMEAEVELTDKAMMRTSPMADVRDIGGLMMRSGFALPLVDVDRITVRYKNVTSLMHDLRYMGEGNALLQRPSTLRRDVMAKTQEIYEKKFPHDDGMGICATFDVVFLTGWSPHESQPQPLKPGAAKVNLGDVLKKPE
ncbi:MAG: methyltransferase domain-containing protein [Sphingomonadales bacterium]|nr:methyltransferase domain-containing protein [Sphingomonadales bacterium]